MNGAALSVMFNIAEGFLRRRDYYAASGRNYISEKETASLIELNESIAKMLRRWQGTLTTCRDSGRRTKDQYQGPGTKD